MLSAKHTLEYLKIHKIDDLTSEFAITVKDYPDRVVLNYDQIESRQKRHPIVTECRNLILAKPTDKNLDYSVISQSFKRFFNMFEGGDQDKFFKFGFAEEKVDGSLISLYFDEASYSFQYATRSSAYAEVETPLGIKFSDLCKEAQEKAGFTKDQLYRLWNFYNSCKLQTLIFELVGPSNRVVTRYPETSLVLTGGRSKPDGLEVTSDILDKIGAFLNVRRPQRFYLNDIEEAMTHNELLDAEQEGVVLVQEYGDYPHHARMKLKNNAYLAIAHARNNGVLTPRRVITLIQTGALDEYLIHFPEDEKFIIPYKEGYERTIKHLKEVWEKHKTIPLKKDFAVTILKSTLLPAPLFALFDGKIDSVESGVQGMNGDTLVDYIERTK